MTESERYAGTTPFQVIYDAFLSLVTDDMYLEWAEEETYADLRNILLAALSKFEFPRFKLYDYTFADTDHPEIEFDQFNFIVEREEINILATLMIVEWVTRQLATIDITRQRYSSKDFAFTSQANHLAKLLDLKNAFIAQSKASQRLYKRRAMSTEGYIVTNYSGLGGKSNAN